MAEAETGKGATSDPSVKSSSGSRLARFFFGEDVFISYARADGITYAARIGDELSSRGLVCYLDQYEPRPGIEVPPSVRRALERSSMLLVVATSAANSSNSIELEIDAFAKRDKGIQVIDLHGALTHARWFSKVRGAPTIADPQGAHLQRPSPEVIDRVDAIASFKRRSDRIRQASIAALALIALSLVGGLTATWTFTKQAATALAREAEAKQQTMALEQRQAQLQSDIERTTKEVAEVKAARQRAIGELESAKVDLTRTQTELRSQDLAAVARDEHKRDAQLGMLLAAEAVEISPTPEAVRALRDSLAVYVPKRSFGEWSRYCAGGGGDFTLTEGATGTRNANTSGFWIRDQKGKIVLRKSNAEARWALIVCSWGSATAARIVSGAPDSIFDLSVMPPKETQVDLSFGDDRLAVGDFAFSADGGRIALVAKNGPIKIWNLDGSVVGEYEPLASITKWAMPSASQLVAVDKEGRVLELVPGPSTQMSARQITTVPIGYSDYFRASVDGRYFVLHGLEGYELWRSNPLAKLRTERDELIVGPDGESIASAYLDSVRLTELEPETGRESRPASQDWLVYDVAAEKLNPAISLASGGHRFALIALSTGVTRVLDPRTGVRLRELEDIALGDGGAFSEDGRSFFGTTGVWSLFPRGIPKVEKLSFSGLPHAAGLSTDGRYLAVWSRPWDGDGKVIWSRWTEEGWKELWSHPTVEYPDSCIVPDHLAVSGDRLAAKVFSDAESSDDEEKVSTALRVVSGTGAVSTKVVAPLGPCDVASVSANGRTLVVARSSGRITTQNVAGGQPLPVSTTLCNPNAVAWSSDGNFFTVMATEKTLLIDAQSRAVVNSFPGAVAAFDPDGARILIADEGRLRLWQRGHDGWISTTQLREFSANHLNVRAISWSHDGLFVITTGDHDLRVWDAVSGDLAWKLETVDSSLLMAAAFQGSTRKIISIWDRYYRVDDCEVCQDAPGLLALARKRVPRRLTDAERRRYLGDVSISHKARDD